MFEPSLEDLPGLWFDHKCPTIRLLVSIELYKKTLPEHIDGDGKNNCMGCFLYRIDHYNCSQAVEQEFLVLQFTHWDNPTTTAAICIDRSVNLTIGQSSDTLTPFSASSEYLATDMVEPLGCASNLNIKSQSTRPFALQVAVLLFQVNQHTINYDALGGQCDWFGHTVFKSLQTLFGQEGEKEVFESDTRGRFEPIPVFKPSPDDVNVICDGLWNAHQQTMKVLVEQGRVDWQQTRADWQHEIDERDRQIDERISRLEQCRISIMGSIIDVDLLACSHTLLHVLRFWYLYFMTLTPHDHPDHPDLPDAI
ncbi:hypothetical protein BDR06DRAFT_1022937 [Suillus hirtellus]|nr:hypothetical protein BDR06DRAFT_1022937 [Suillus hirtellus]